MSNVKALIEAAFKEAGERESRFIEARKVTGTSTVGVKGRGNPYAVNRKDEVAVGRLVQDNRICWRCGSRWGLCEHTND